MAPRRILVTGAAGFVGRHLLPILAAGLPDAEILAAGFDLTDADAVVSGVRDARPDGCVHLAAISAIPAARADPDAAWAVNLRGTLTLAQAILAAAPDCLMVFASTADAYGASFRAGRPLDETAPLAPMNAYGATKAAADLALGAMQAADGLRLVRLRPFNHTGPGQTAAFAIPAFARQIARIEAGRQPPALRVGALDARRDFLDVRDVCDAYLRCLTADDLPTGAIFNIASGVPRRVGDALADLLRLADVTAEIETDPARLRPSDIPSAIGDSRLARRLLGWSPRVNWETTLAEILEDWRGRVAAGTE